MRYLDEEAWFEFPAPTDKEGVVGWGGDLSPGMLLSAYRQGVFPWYTEGAPVWWNPDPRFVVLPAEVHLCDSMRRLLRRRKFRLTLDRAFGDVIQACASVPRRGQSGTWINTDMVEAYSGLHRLGYAHSVEAWLGDELAGGLYGLSLGRCFFGESMYSLVPNASKAAFIALALLLGSQGFLFIDSQVRTSHVQSLGGKDMPRPEYLGLLARGLSYPTCRGDWQVFFPEFPASDWALDRGLFASPLST